METGERIPDDLRATARDIVERIAKTHPWKIDAVLDIARALLAERERCAKIAESHINPLGTRSWDADGIAAAIRT